VPEQELRQTVERFRSDRNPDDFGRLYERFYPDVHRFVRSLCPSFPEEEVFDLVQETFLTVHDRIATLRDTSFFRTWLFSVAKNRTWNASRKHSWELRRRNVSVDIESIPSPSGDGMKECIAEFENSLPEKDRPFFSLRFLESMGFEEIASVCGCSVRKAKYKAESALNALERHLKTRGWK
jgi:RNA polymerase sigma-70 factor (ECF subfamily)